jgi:hypothetical protein
VAEAVIGHWRPVVTAVRNDCPTVWIDDVTGDFVFKGWKISDPEMLAQTTPDHREVVMRFPARMAQFFQEVAGARRGPAV